MEWKSNSLLWAVLISCCSLFILFPIINFCLFTYFINSYFLFYVGTFNCLKPCVPAWAPTCLLYYCTSFKWYPGTFWSETWLNSSGLSLISLIPEGLGQGCFLHVPYGHLCPWSHYGSIQPCPFTGQGIWAASVVEWGKVNSLCVGGITAAITCQDHTVLLSPHFGSLSLFLPKLFLLARAVNINFKIVLCSISGILEFLNPVSSKRNGLIHFCLKLP